MSLTRVWKTAGVFVNPKGMTRYSKCPRWVLNLPFIPLSDMIQVICVTQVEFRKHRGMRKWFEGGVKEWDGILILNGDVVK